MEPSILFAEFILGMCVVHLVGMASEHIAQWRAKSSGHRATSNDLVKKTIRSDWYVFFSCSDLYGKEPKKEQNQAVKPADKARSSRDRRPTLRAS
jgi:hypothetical protein